jgi:hypothetical protein
MSGSEEWKTQAKTFKELSKTHSKNCAHKFLMDTDVEGLLKAKDEELEGVEALRTAYKIIRRKHDYNECTKIPKLEKQIAEANGQLELADKRSADLFEIVWKAQKIVNEEYIPDKPEHLGEYATFLQSQTTRIHRLLNPCSSQENGLRAILKEGT